MSQDKIKNYKKFQELQENVFYILIMPKASKIKIIDIVEDEQPNVEAVEAVEAVEPVEAVVKKAKPKPRAKAKPKPEAVLEPVVEEEQPKAVEPVVVEEKIKPKLELFPCPRCGKELTQKGLKYSHKCPADKVLKQPEPEPVAVVAPVRVSRPRAPRAKPEKEPISEELIQDEIRRRMEHAKVARRDRHQDNIKRLAVTIV